MPTWMWIILSALVLLVSWQQIRIFQIHRNSKKREELFQIVAENAADMIALVDVKGRRLYNSPAYRNILGYSPTELGETSSFEQIHPDDRFKVLEAAREARATGIGKKLEYRIRHKNGSWKVLESVASAIRNDKGEVDKLVIVNRDITDRKHAEEQLEHNSFHDGLTGLPNRRLFLNWLQQMFARRQRDPRRQHAVLFVDVDEFKNLNEKLGTRIGDLLLVQIGIRLQATLRSDDTISRPKDALPTFDAVLSRLGGDEFTILLDAISDPSDTMRIANRIQEAVREPFILEGQEIRASVSIGIAVSTSVQSHAEELLQEAETAMRRTKALGGGRCEVFDEAMHSRAVNRLHLESDLRTAVDKQQFRIFYQPIVELSSKRIFGFEALLRWEHPQQGLISPYKFLDAAEDSGLLVSIGRWLLMQSARQLGAWRGELANASEIALTVNLSGRQFVHPELIAETREAIRESAIDPGALHLELSESILIAEPKLASTVLPELKRLGVKIVLDNFGSGPSSLRVLWELPIDAVKIDKSLVSQILADLQTCDFVETIVSVGQRLKLAVVAEGIENRSQMERLRHLGCKLGQGYWFSHPLDAEAARKFVLQQETRSPVTAAMPRDPRS